MRKIITLLIFSLTMSCNAEKNNGHKCEFVGESLQLLTPESSDIANSFWQQDVDGYEAIDRLHINYKNGSVAVIEHKYCSMYNFEVAYYSKSTSEFLDVASLKKTLSKLFKAAAIADESTNRAVMAMSNRLEEKGFSPDQAIATAFDDSTKNNKRAEYSISYLPLEDSSLHKAAVFVYMGIGGEH